MRDFLKKHLGWTIFRPAAVIAGLQAYSWLFGLDPIILGWVAIHKVVTVLFIVTFAAGTHVWWDREKQVLQIDYKTILDDISKKTDKIGSNRP